MKKIILIIFVLICSLSIAACDTTNNNNNNQPTDPSLEGIDISKFEMPQTEFLHDGHKLTKLEEVMKLVIEEGTFVYDKYLVSIGYKYIIEESSKTILYAYYSVNELRLIYLQIEGKIAHSSYFKLSNKENMFSICHKIQYFSGRRQDFLAVMNCERSLFNSSYVGEYELYRGYNTQTKEEVTNLLVANNNSLLVKFNDITTTKINISLAEFGFTFN